MSSPKTDPFDSLGLSVIQRLGRSNRGQVLLVSSARPKEGKTFVSRRLAQRFVALVDGPILLVDANPDAKPASKDASPDDDIGLFTCLNAGHIIPGSIQGTAIPSLSIMPTSGSRSASLLFHMNALSRLLDAFRGQFALTVLDAGTLDNAGCLAQQADGSVIVVDSRHTRRDIVQGALESPHVERERILGVVLNRKPQYVPRWIYRSLL